MNMFSRKNFVVVGVVLLAFCTLARAEELAVWLAEDAEEAGQKILLPDDKGGFAMELTDASGVKIGGKPAVGKDRKSLEFSGTQQTCFRTKNPFPPVGGNLKISCVAKIDPEQVTEDGTLMRYGTVWELRYDVKAMAITFIVWNEQREYKIASVPMPHGEWTEIVATIQDGTIRIEADNRSAEKAVESLRQEPTPPALLLGASGTRPPTDGGSLRPFHGSLADVRISLD